MVAFDKNGQGYFTFEEFMEHKAYKPLVAAIHPNVRPDYIANFLGTFNKHMSAWSVERMEKDYGFKNLKSVFWKKKEKCFHVHFNNGEWWHYTLKGEWY